MKVLIAILSIVAIPVIWHVSNLVGIESPFWQGIFTFFNWLFYFLILVGYSLTYSSSRLNRVHIKKDDKPTDEIKQLATFAGLISPKIKISKESNYVSSPVVDENDIELAKMGIDVKNMIDKVETYVIESIFIGALTFGGFLTIISSDKIQENIESLKSVVPNLIVLVSDIYSLSLEVILSDIVLLTSGYGLFALVAIEALICSSFFILVLGARIKFASISEKATYLLDLAHVFNSKEEEVQLLIYQGVDNLSNRKDYLSNKVDQLLVDVENAKTRLIPLFQYIAIFRNLGIYMFYVTLISSGLYFSISTSVFIFTLLAIGFVLKYVSLIYSSSRVEFIMSRYLKPRSKRK
ncbi:hypothetical protein [Neolewinella antarctica]|uniref:Gustatory receptor n=1 Tax=Neolewinella antarctica TaxID=442734 RepID=A0ABX0XHN1_9BACT|nr:hypothetical protein [Neolewinella antarctica]NJC28263.1 hypothetical protein [Neolewinella antarctica]